MARYLGNEHTWAIPNRFGVSKMETATITKKILSHYLGGLVMMRHYLGFLIFHLIQVVAPHCFGYCNPNQWV
jgi:hypothetical protein